MTAYSPQQNANRAKKTGSLNMRLPACIYISREKTLLLVAVAIAAEELINTTGGIDELVLASEEWVAGRGDFELNQWILLAVDDDGLLGVDGRT